MKRISTVFNFTSFASSEESNPVLQALGLVNAQLKTITEPDFPENASPPAPCILLFGSEIYPRNKVLNFLSNEGCQNTLAVFTGNVINWDTGITERCAEFMTWPCKELELSIRLDRISKYFSPSNIEIDEQNILDEFVSLNLIGRSPNFIEVLQLIKKIARCDAPVLIEGETGTGKELAARAIHYLGARRDFPFIPVNCGAIPDSLIESEMFGHKKGAFTDAKETYPGVIEQAQGGTLFLDEVDALSEKAQVTLLRFLQDRDYKSLGDKQIKKADVRVVAAINTDITKLVDQGRFRQDLMYRLNVMSVTLPPLRDRNGDIELLARHFSDQCRSQYDHIAKKLHPELLAWMNRHSWPGNIRELENFVLREYMLEEGGVICGQTIDLHQTERRKNSMDRRVMTACDWGLSKAKSCLIAEFEKKYLCWLMKETNGNVTLAAKKAGKERRALGKLLKKYGIDKNQHRKVVS